MAAIKTGVLYLQKDRFQLFSPYDGRVLEFRFVPEIVRDLDIINGSLLANLLKAFVLNSRIPPSNLIFVLSENTYFTKDFLMHPVQKPTGPGQPEVTKEVLQKQADDFIEHVPFDNVVSKTIPIKDGLKVCATNKDFYETVAGGLEHQGFTIGGVFPGIVLGNGLSLRPVMDSTMASLILQKVSAVKQYDLLGQQVFQPVAKQETEEVDEVEVERLQNKKPEKKRLYALAGVFAMLIVVLVIVYVQSQTPPPKQTVLANTTPPPPPPAAIVLATPIPTTAPAVSPSLSETGQLTVEIISSSGSSTTAQTLQNQLDTYKFASVNMVTQTAIGSAGAIVSFAPTVNQNVRDAVLTEVKKVASNVTVQEKQSGSSDITIVLGQ